ncbi:MAG: cytochrome b/b6 domain-containing protein [Parvularculaceae bacterium]|nr:cytochrome b/b6 domain-containing protein [Parvularculaceae bacterium]
MAGAGGPYGTALRRLHLAIACFIVALAITGFMIYFRKPLGLQALKLTLVWTHASIAYAFLFVLAARVYFGVAGGEANRFRHVLARADDIKRLFAASASGRRGLKFAGRSPLSRTLATIIYATIAANAATGLVRAGTDLYLPPLGPFVRAYVAADGVDPAVLRPAARVGVDTERHGFISRAKIPFGKAHIYGAFVIAAAALIHAAGVVTTEWSAPNDRKARGRARLMLFGPRRM